MEDLRSFGKMMSFGLPVIGGSVALISRDSHGAAVLILGTTMTYFTTTALKHFIHAPRPNMVDNRSFPSNHTSGTFSAATFLNVRYGMRVGIPAYLLAGATATSRVLLGRHYVRDTVAGAILGTTLMGLITSRDIEISKRGNVKVWAGNNLGSESPQVGCNISF